MNTPKLMKKINYKSTNCNVDIIVSNKGDVYDSAGNKLKPSYQPYAYVTAYNPKCQRCVRVSVSRAVMMAFQPHPDAANLQVDHIDCNPRRNCVSNLRWVDRATNNSRQHSRKLKSLNHKSTPHPNTVVQAYKAGQVIEADNCKQLSKILGCSSTILYRILDPNDYPQTVFGYSIRRISKPKCV